MRKMAFCWLLVVLILKQRSLCMGYESATATAS
jgi:hypothetical protein